MANEVFTAILLGSVGLVFWGIQRLLSAFVDRIRNLETQYHAHAARIHDLERTVRKLEAEADRRLVARLDALDGKSGGAG